MQKKTFYITTPIYYPSGKLHIGHSYTTVAADAMARYKRMQGYDVMFLTGTDEHGQKIEDKAKANKVTPKEYVDNIVFGIKELWQRMDITNDKFIRTTDKYHEKAVQNIFNRLYENGDIYKGYYEGLYCKPCEAFWTDTQAVDGKCPDCGESVYKAQEEAYFFRLSKYADKLVKYYEDHPGFIEPQSRQNEMVNNFIKPGLEDLCVSRTTFKWGIPVTFDDKHVIYVWIDALSNYITALGYSSEDESLYKKYWPADIQLVGKEIVRFHTIIWPAMLLSLGEPLPEKVFGHGWLLLEGGKMSKSKGNVVDPIILCDRYGVDAVRYFLLREVAFGSDGVFSNENLIHRINFELANDLGNLVSRTVSMVEKYFGGTIPAQREATQFDKSLIELANETKNIVEKQMDKLLFSNAIAEIWKLISRTNKYIDETTPWILAKNNDMLPTLANIMYNLCESIRIISILIGPIMPNTSPKIQQQLGLSSLTNWEDAGTFGLPESYTVVKGDIIFPRIDMDEELNALEELFPQNKQEEQEPQGIAQIGIEDFAKVELTIAKVVDCVPVKKAKKLLKLTLDIGNNEKRTVASGIAQWYSPSELIDKKVVLVSNLKPAVFCGVESQGMILAADSEDGKVKILFADDIPEGSKLR